MVKQFSKYFDFFLEQLAFGTLELRYAMEGSTTTTT